MVLQHAVLAAVVPAAKPAVADDALRRVLTVLEIAFDFLRGHAAAQGHAEGEGGVWLDVERFEGGGGEMSARVR